VVALIDQYQCRNGLSNLERRLALACGRSFAYPLGIGWICEVEVFELTLNNSISYPIHGSSNVSVVWPGWIEILTRASISLKKAYSS